MQIDIVATLIALLTFFGISALMALSLNLEYGVAGIPNFGKAVFVSIGAYTAGITYTRLLPVLVGLPVIDPCGDELAKALQLRSAILASAPDIGFANFALTLLIAALSAEGKSLIQNSDQIDRGYQYIDTRLQALGAEIRRL